MTDIPGWILAIMAIVAGGCGLYAWFAAQMAGEREARLKLERDLAAYKLHVAQNHVTNASLRETEERLINALEKLATRVETMAARIENVFVEMAKARVAG